MSRAYRTNGSLHRRCRACIKTKAPLCGGALCEPQGHPAKHEHKKAPLCKGGSRGAGGGLLIYPFAGTINRRKNLDNPSDTAALCHLPLHKGGF